MLQRGRTFNFLRADKWIVYFNCSGVAQGTYTLQVWGATAGEEPTKIGSSSVTLPGPARTAVPALPHPEGAQRAADEGKGKAKDEGKGKAKDEGKGEAKKADGYDTLSITYPQSSDTPCASYFVPYGNYDGAGTISATLTDTVVGTVIPSQAGNVYQDPSSNFWCIEFDDVADAGNPWTLQVTETACGVQTNAQAVTFSFSDPAC